MLKVRNWRNERRLNSASKSLYAALKTDLVQQGRTAAGISESQMMQRFMALDECKYVSRDEKTFTSRIMP